MRTRTRQHVITAALFALITGARVFAQPPADAATPVADLISSAMSKSRSGEWRAAAEEAQRVVDRSDASVTERAEAYFLIASTRASLGEKQAAAQAAAEFDKLAPEIPADHWAHAWMDRVRPRLGQTPPQPTAGRQPAQPVPAPDRAAPSAKPVGAGAFPDLPTAIWNVRQFAMTGRHAEAAQLASEIVAKPGLNASMQCDVLLHLAFAQIKLRQPAQADQAFEQFRVAAQVLDTDDRLRLQMIELRRSLSLPPLDGLTFEGARFAPPATDTYWTAAEPASEGVDAAAMERLRLMCERSGADGVLVARRGHIVLEWYSPFYREPMMTMSSCKSITGLLAGLLISEGKVALDDPLSKYLPSWSDGPRGKVTIRHLLTMTSGLTHVPSVNQHVAGEGWNAFADKQQPVTEPGTKWQYTNEGVQLLSPVLERAAGVPLWEFAQQRLFIPIGATSTQMWRDAKGATNTYADARTTLREFARFGELVRRKGAWPVSARPIDPSAQPPGDGAADPATAQIVPAEWIATMTTPNERSRTYGMLWWLSDSPRSFSMRGFLDTDVYVFPELDVVVARAQSRAYLHATETYNAEAMATLISESCR